MGELCRSGQPFSSSPSVSTRPPFDVVNSDARKRTPRSDSAPTFRWCLLSRWRQPHNTDIHTNEWAGLCELHSKLTPQSLNHHRTLKAKRRCDAFSPQKRRQPSAQNADQFTPYALASPHPTASFGIFGKTETDPPLDFEN